MAGDTARARGRRRDRARDRRRGRRLLVGGLVALLVLLVGAAVWTGGRLREAQARADDRVAAVEAARRHAMALLSVGHRTVDTDIRRLLAGSTGLAKQQYTANAERLKETTVKNKVVQTGVLRAAGLVSITDKTAEVLVVGDVVIRWEGAKTPPQERFYRWNMGVTKVDGNWLVSSAEQVQ
jgi:Mce-associated membrane protein